MINIIQFERKIVLRSLFAAALWFGPSTQKGEVAVLMGGSVGSSWSTGSWHSQNTVDHSGAFGGVGECKTLYPGGGIKLSTGQRGVFNGHTSMEMYVRGVYGPADVSVSLVGHQGACQDIQLAALTKSGNSNGYDRYDIYMGLFEANRPQTVSGSNEKTLPWCTQKVLLDSLGRTHKEIMSDCTSDQGKCRLKVL